MMKKIVSRLGGVMVLFAGIAIGYAISTATQTSQANADKANTFDKELEGISERYQPPFVIVERMYRDGKDEDAKTVSIELMRMRRAELNALCERHGREMPVE